ncbi:hypothetical protein Fmac_010666 [Flemingia macrophylla]|uniref:Transmembrane protein n=1 Tax=Flemingia macrophylla TaxID=520843 RepID=A0ABD1MK92_9FABA
MATVDVRDVWQKAVNRCFVQEDAKRAPMLACCQSSKLVNAGPASAPNESDHVVVNATHFNQNFSFPNTTPDSRWWMQLQSNYGFQKGLPYEQLSALEDEVEDMKGSNENKTCKGDANYDYSKNCPAYPQLVDMMGKHETMKIDSVDCLVSKQTNDLSFDSDYSWIGVEKLQPWWRTTDRDELGCFLWRKSLNHIENCDLPPPQRYLRGEPCADISHIKTRLESFDWETKSSAFSDFNVQAKESLESRLMHRKLGGPSTNKGRIDFDCDKYSSNPTIHGGVTEQVFEGDHHSKAQLIEALCHSQTHAREAEEIAKQACAEREHILALLFMQASQLLAYKQWFQLTLLQLKALNIHVKNKDQPISTSFRLRKLKYGNGKQEIVGKAKRDITTYAVAFALGLSFVGAGLLLGWTVGYMLSLS